MSNSQVSRSFFGEQLPPSTYILKIQNFPSLPRPDNQNTYETRLFEVGGYKWKLIFYHKYSGSIFLYLKIEDVASLPKDWEVFANVEFFLLNQVEDRFMVIPTENGIERFHSSKTRSFGKLGLSLQKFNDPKNGYLVNGCCTFAVRVGVISEKGECLSVKDKPEDGIFTWKILHFSTLDQTLIYSDEFIVGETNWKLSIRPRSRDGKDEFLDLNLEKCRNESGPRNRWVQARIKLRVLNQRGGSNVEYQLDNWYNDDERRAWGLHFMNLKDLYDKGKGFLVNDTVKVQVEFLAVSVTTYFPKPDEE